MENAIAEIDSRELSDGVVFAAWFLNNPNGPTAWALGSTGPNRLFYRWLHFMGGRTWVIGSFDPAAASDPGQEALYRAIARFHSDDAVHNVDESPMFGAFPSFIITNGKSDVDLCLREILEVSLSRADWSQEYYLIRKYGIDFYGRAAVETQHAYKQMRSDPSLDPAYVERLASAFEQAHGAVDDIPEQLPLVDAGTRRRRGHGGDRPRMPMSCPPDSINLRRCGQAPHGNLARTISPDCDNPEMPTRHSPAWSSSSSAIRCPCGLQV